MSEKPELFLFNTTPISDLPIEAFDDFKRWVLGEDIKPSAALRKVMKKYNCPKMDSSMPRYFLKHTYPGIDVGRSGLRFKIVDSAYPNSDPNQFSDDDFDEGIKEILSLPPIEG